VFLQTSNGRPLHSNTAALRRSDGVSKPSTGTVCRRWPAAIPR
jgi:hypothetical protein